MSNPKPFMITDAAAAEMLAECRRFGAHRVETGGFVLVHRGDSVAKTVALAGDIGIHRDPRLFDISGAANDKLQDWAIDQDSIISVQWHTHRFEAYMSETDLTCGINLPGMITAIIPDFESPPESPEDWGWWIFSEDGWQTISPPVSVEGDVALVRFDERGVSSER